MKNVDDYLKVRHAVRIEGSQRAGGGAAVSDRPADREQDDEVLSGAAGLQAQEAAGEAEAYPFILVIDRILRDDKSQPKKQQHTAKRIFERLRDEYGFTGGITIVKDYVGWLAAADARDVRAAGASAGACSGTTSVKPSAPIVSAIRSPRRRLLDFARRCERRARQAARLSARCSAQAQGMRSSRREAGHRLTSLVKTSAR